MTSQRRVRRRPPPSAPEERLRTLGLDASPRRLRVRIPRAPSEPSPGSGTSTGTGTGFEAIVPRAPYAVEDADTPYRPEPRRPTPAELWGSTETTVQAKQPPREDPPQEDPAQEDPALEETPTVRLRPAGSVLTEPESPWNEPPRTAAGRDARAAPRGPVRSGGESGDTSRRRSLSAEHLRTDEQGLQAHRRVEGAGNQNRVTEQSLWEALSPAGPRTQGEPGRGSADPPDDGPGPGTDPSARREQEEPEGGRHQGRSVSARPPSGYTELNPEAPDSVLERAAERWGSRASLSRRAVAVLLVLGLVAVAGAFLVLRERPGEVTVPELVSEADPASPGTSDQPGDQASGGSGAPDAGGGADPPSGDVVVHVGGEVAEPGLYTMPAGARVADAVEEAGGPLPDADLDLVNLARTLTDGERILVGVPQPEGGSGGAPEGSGSPVNLNLAGQAELETLPGIGQKKAQQILAHRESLGGSFSSVEDLLGVDGIAEKTFKNLEPLVTVG